MEIRIAGFERESIVDGPGIRYVLFTQGCPHNCVGCHNPQTHSMDGGKMMTVEEIWEDINSRPRITGVTFSGGDPFVQPEPLYELAKKVKDAGLHLTVYSGFTYEKLLGMSKNDRTIKGLLDLADLLVDGPFIMEKKDLALAFRGSSNQRLIDLKETSTKGEIVLWEVPSESGRVLIGSKN